MDTPFRNRVDALKSRLASLDEELAALRTKSREYEATRERLAQLEREHLDVRREIDARTTPRPVPFLDTLRVASPCNESWDAMIGDDRSRFCARCQKHVHNISEMTRDEAETFLEAAAGSACVRMYQRDDGTVLTADCPVGVRRKRVKRLFLATIGGGLAAAAGVLAFWRYEETVVMGDVGVVEPAMTGQAAATTTPPAPTYSEPQRFATPPEGGRTTLGIAPRRPEQPHQTPPRPPPKPSDDLGF